MAIEKTVFSGQNKETRGAEIVTWLTANGSEFFDSVEQSSDYNYVKCYKGDKLALEICIYGSTSKTTVYAANGTSSDAAMNGLYWDYGIKTSKGLLIYFNYTSSPGCVAIVKTNEGGTFIARRYNGWCAADFDNSASIDNYDNSGLHTWTNSSDLTVLAPIVASHADTYADGLYLQLFAQYPNTDSILTVNGKRYYSDGVFALEE